MEIEENTPIPQESPLPEANADEQISARSESVVAASAEPEAGEANEIPSAEFSETTLPDGSRVIVIPKGYEHYADGWYPKNPIRRFMERWGSFLNLGLILLLISAILLSSGTRSLPATVQDPSTAPSVETPVETEASIPELPAEAFVPTAPAFSVPVQTDCFTLNDGVLDFLPDKFDPCPILQIPDTLNGEPVITIADGAFENLSGITTVLVPSGIRNIGEHAFSGCRDLRGVCLADTVRVIGDAAFDGCTSLESILIPASMHSIAANAFEDCAAMRYIFYNGLFADWQELYSSYITPFTFVLCLDGDFPHASELPLG